MATERIYKVGIKIGDKKRVAMVRAASAAQATRHFMKDMLEVKAASTNDVASHMEKGGTIQTAGEQPAEQPQEQA